jgi:hypothetical protein
MSDETKTPTAGEWWVSNSGRVAYIVGLDHDGNPVWQLKGYRYICSDEMDFFLSGYHHEPRCTGWDWVEPSAIDPGEGWELLLVGMVLDVGDEVWFRDGWFRVSSYGQCVGDISLIAGPYRRKIKPVQDPFTHYYPSDVKNVANLRLDSETDTTCVKQTGVMIRDNWPSGPLPDRKRLTEAEALARVTPPERFTAEELTKSYYSIPAADLPVVESPDDWVEIDRHEHSEHIPRSGIDVLLRSENDPELAASRNASLTPSICSKISDITWNGWKWVCRRKDLPAKQPRYQSDVTCSIAASERERKKQPAAKRVPVRLWVSHRLKSESGDWPMRCTPASEEFDDGGRSPWLEIKSDGNGFYVEVCE